MPRRRRGQDSSGEASSTGDDLGALLAALRQDDQDPDLWLRTARAFRASGDREKALRCAQAAARLEPEAEGPRHLLAELESKGEAGEGARAAADPPKEGAEEEDPHEATESTRRWVPEEERPSLSPEEAAAQLVRELAPRETAPCPACGTLVEVDEPWCFGCGQEMEETEEGQETALERRVRQARSRLRERPEDPDALFTVGADHALREAYEEALELLNRLTLLEPDYPGLWWLKARVFEGMGKETAAQASMRRALKGEDG